ncbi:hypothetical protein [Brumimicrobium aurantiacum]|uniref:Uncharacterized protein n=1 Tax=Brumimicrobium aurantiacum TaxID=1737063 RepID=A0A3E1EYZ2_9FLAO|nr:hypothetical protein [Brumimicrobium aurantiacum]RFC54703.1 hypothetical protein DXU93_06870 [Brumimicrobium aurantiacum]
MKLIQSLIIFLCCPTVIFTQTLRLAIQENGKSVYYATIEKNNIFFSTNSKSHVFNMPVKSNDFITIKHELYEDYSFRIKKNLSNSDTINKIIPLTIKSGKMKLQTLDEFTITNSKYRDIFNIEDEFIIDYYPFPLNRFFVVSRIGRNHFIKIIDTSGDEILMKELVIKPKEIFLDAIGNFHLITKDSAYQIYIEQHEIKLMHPITKKDFDIDLKNLVTLGTEGAFHQSISKHNQMYSLTRIINKEISNIYESFDKEGYENADYHYQRVIDYYMLFTPLKDNVIVMGIWDGDLMTLNNYAAKMLEMTSWSDKIASKPLDVSAHGLQDKIIILDAVRDSIFQIDNHDFTTKEVEAKFEFTGTYFKDYFYDNIYMYTNVKGEILISKINVEDGTSSKIAKLPNMRQPRNIKVINDKVYFTKLEESRYNRIVTVKN